MPFRSIGSPPMSLQACFFTFFKPLYYLEQIFAKPLRIFVKPFFVS